VHMVTLLEALLETSVVAWLVGCTWWCRTGHPWRLLHGCDVLMAHPSRREPLGPVWHNVLRRIRMPGPARTCSLAHLGTR
jgi:hypothetical protein